MFLRSLIFSSALLSLTSCTPETSPAEVFLEVLSEYCGKAYAGKLVSTDEVDASFAEADIVMHVRDCSPEEFRIPLHVGENRSRTWILTRHEEALRLKHDHRHEDGETDAITMYGGDSASATRKTYEDDEEKRWELSFAFPADDFSKEMFDREGIPDSKQNTWVVELKPNEDLFAYQMSRPNRFFRIEFDLSTPVETPPPAWGHE